MRTGWTSISERVPMTGEPIWYWFEVFEAVYPGYYAKTEDGHCFYGECGWLIDDVTWWQPRLEDDPPDPPTLEQRTIDIHWEGDSG